MNPKTVFGSRKDSALVVLCAVLFVPACSDSISQPVPSSIPQTENIYYQAAAAELAQRGGIPRPAGSRNVILFIGDGMDVATVTASRLLAHQPDSKSHLVTPLSFESFPQLALARTYGSNVMVSDSANTATALLTGIKTGISAVGTDSGSPDAGCDDSRVASVLELAEQQGLATGIVTNTRITHATPAAAYAHVPSRKWELDWQVPEVGAKAGCVDIARQLLEMSDGDGVDVMLGGGRAAFFPQDRPDEEAAGVVEDAFEPSVVRRAERRVLGSAKFGARRDGRNLVEEWLQAKPAGAYVWNQDQLDELDAHTAPVLGLFDSTHMEFEVDRDSDFGGEPSLAQMTRFALQRLAKNPRGYFLLVEGGLIDHAHHGNNAARALTETHALADAVAVASELTDVADTLIIVTADHGHTLSISGYPRRQDSVLGLTTMLVGPPRPGMPPWMSYSILNYASGPGAVAKRDLQNDATTAVNYLQPALNRIPNAVHGGQDVPVYSRGPGSELLGGTVEQNYLFHVMVATLGLAPK
jgi:alkaline phosphatase